LSGSEAITYDEVDPIEQNNQGLINSLDFKAALNDTRVSETNRQSDVVSDAQIITMDNFLATLKSTDKNTRGSTFLVNQIKE
jgi:hypothetical protein